jgi:fermentation-respiration switch protein FrsA (DUF1100 family)
LVIHGEDDEIDPFSMGKEIFQRATPGKKFVAVKGAGYNNLSMAGGRKYWVAIENFLLRTDGMRSK